MAGFREPNHIQFD